MNITGRTLIFKSNYGYSTTISTKNQDGTYKKMYVSVQLPKGVELENKTFIEITSGFLSFYTDKNGIPKIKIVVMDFNQEMQNNNDELEPDFLPF